MLKNDKIVEEFLLENSERMKILQGLKFRETSIRNIVDNSIKALKNPDTVNVEVLYALADETVWIDHERIVKVLLELEINAVEAMPDGGLLQILVEDNTSWILLTIRDTGRGISTENKELLFTPFFTTKPAGEGTGLGLPTVYGVIKAHGGGLSLESNADPSKGPTGTTIRLSLPRRQALKDIKGKLIIHEEE